MVDNQEKRKKMKKTRYAILVLLSSLLTLVGCSRREILDDYPVTGINIRLNWEGVTDRLPEGVRIIFSMKRRNTLNKEVQKAQENENVEKERRPLP